MLKFSNNPVISIREGLRPLLYKNKSIYLAAKKIWRFLKLIPAPNNIRIVVLGKAMLDESLLKEMRTEEKFNSIIDDLISFTGLTEAQAHDYLLRKPEKHFESEFRWHSPKSDRELAWFYRCGYGFLFCNAAHPYWEKLDFLSIKMGRILDYGAGVGNNVITLAKRGFKIDYFEISIMQEAFARFRAYRHGLDDISFISPFVKGKFNPVECISNDYGVIILHDVLEHVPNYHVLLNHLINHLKSGGYIIESSPFDDISSKNDLHLKPSIPLKEAMKGMQQIEPGIWKKLN